MVFLDANNRSVIVLKIFDEEKKKHLSNVIILLEEKEAIQMIGYLEDCSQVQQKMNIII